MHFLSGYRLGIDALEKGLESVIHLAELTMAELACLARRF
jgi:hypothetical protein